MSKDRRNNYDEPRRLKWWAKLLVVAMAASLVVAGWKGIPLLEEKVEEYKENFQSEETTSLNVEESQSLYEENLSNGKDEDLPEESSKAAEESKQPEKEENSKAKVTARGYSNSFAGYTSAIVANGGLRTTTNSYYDANGLDVSIKIEDDDNVIIEAFKNDEIDFFFMTVNKMPIVCKELQEAGKEAVIPYITDTSTGGDGIVANNEYNSIASLQNARIGMARDSVSEAMLIWLLNMQNEVDANAVISNFELYNSTQEAVDAFVRGEVEAVATWDLASALEKEGSHLLFSSKDAEYLIIDALVVDKDFAEQNPDVVTGIIDGCIAVVSDINSNENADKEDRFINEYAIIRGSVPDFETYGNKAMTELLGDSRQLGYAKNIEVFEIAKGIYEDFCAVWNQIGFETSASNVDSLFDMSYITPLQSKWESSEVLAKESIIATETDIDREALMSYTAHILFVPNMAELREDKEEENMAMLDEFVRRAKILNKTIIIIEGNVSLSPGNTSGEFDYKLSYERAKVPKEYMVEQGIDAERIVIMGNGGDKPIATNDTPEGRELNRNCIFSFYQGETE